MKILSSLLASATFGLILVSSATAETIDKNKVYFKAPINFAGTGCSSGTISVAGADTNTLSILFDSYDAGKDSSSKRKRVSCNFAVPVHVPEGYQISVMTADWQGFAQGKTSLHRKYFFAGQPHSPWKITRFNAPDGIDFLETDRKMHKSLSSSKCGEDRMIRINSAIRALKPNSYIAVDTLDLANKVEFQLQWQKCDQEQEDTDENSEEPKKDDQDSEIDQKDDYQEENKADGDSSPEVGDKDLDDKQTDKADQSNESNKQDDYPQDKKKKSLLWIQ